MHRVDHVSESRLERRFGYHGEHVLTVEEARGSEEGRWFCAEFGSLWNESVEAGRQICGRLRKRTRNRFGHWGIR